MDSEGTALSHFQCFDDNVATQVAALIAASHRVQQGATTPRGLRTGRRPNRSRRAAEAHKRLLGDYFVENPVYGAKQFRRRFQMQRPLFLRIVDAVQAADPYFQKRQDATGKLSLSALQKCTAAL